MFDKNNINNVDAKKLLTLDGCIKENSSKESSLLYNKISHNELKWRDEMLAPKTFVFHPC